MCKLKNAYTVCSPIIYFGLQTASINYLEITAKTNGWIAGNAYLNSNLSARFGLTAWFY